MVMLEILLNHVLFDAGMKKVTCTETWLLMLLFQQQIFSLVGVLMVREDILILDVCLNHQILSSLLSRSPEILEEKAYWY